MAAKKAAKKPAKKPAKRYVVLARWAGPEHVYGPFIGKRSANACVKKLGAVEAQVVELEKA